VQVEDLPWTKATWVLACDGKCKMWWKFYVVVVQVGKTHDFFLNACGICTFRDIQRTTCFYASCIKNRICFNKPGIKLRDRIPQEQLFYEQQLLGRKSVSDKKRSLYWYVERVIMKRHTIFCCHIIRVQPLTTLIYHYHYHLILRSKYFH
jgi:hypothetical protein